MAKMGQQIVRSGGYALLATAFVLACSLLLAGEEPERQAAMWSDATDSPSLTGSADHSPPDFGAGR
jgi:hypothetical protein